MELLLSGVAVQAFALAVLALLVLNGDAGRTMLVRIRPDGRTESRPDEAAEHRRRLVVRGLIGLFVGGTLLALVGLPRV